ncbi:MAG: HEAT repeat domain-containing protein [Candidatus Freyarchaeota archaeon]
MDNKQKTTDKPEGKNERNKKLIKQLSYKNPTHEHKPHYPSPNTPKNGLTDKSAPQLVKILQDQNEEVRNSSAVALCRYDEKGLVLGEVVRSLVGLLNDDRGFVVEAAWEVLDRVSEHYYVSREELIGNPSLAGGDKGGC